MVNLKKFDEELLEASTFSKVKVKEIISLYKYIENYSLILDLVKNCPDFNSVKLTKKITKPTESASVNKMQNENNKSWQSRCEQLGDVCELEISKRLRSHGHISKPHGEAPYDIIYDSNGKLVKVQVKHGLVKRSDHSDNVSVQFRTVDSNGDRYNKKDVDCFAVYSSELDKAWLVPFKVAGEHTKCTLNIVRTNRSQGLDCKAYEFETQIAKINKSNSTL